MNVGIVAIGRNEGERLRVCLTSARRDCTHVVYVDSGSTDGSLELAQSLGVHIVNLDLSKPFTAARARNEGFARLKEIDPNLEAAQFIDGDCEIVEGWIAKAQSELMNNPKAAVVCGRRRERFPAASIYNKLCDMEWNTPIGIAIACGGDALIRASAFEQVGGYNPAAIAGEEPEMCVRLRQNGWTIHRIDAEMTLHDAAITRFGQWWKRTLRSGHAYAQGYFLHGPPPPASKSSRQDKNGVWDGFAELPVTNCPRPLLNLARNASPEPINEENLAQIAPSMAQSARSGPVSNGKDSSESVTPPWPKMAEIEPPLTGILLHENRVWDGSSPPRDKKGDGDNLSRSVSLPFRQREVRSIQKWATLPILFAALFVTIILAVARQWCYLGLLPLLLYPLLAVKVAWHRIGRHLAGETAADAMVYGIFVVLGKFPQYLGIRRFYAAQRRGERIGLIEYKGPTEQNGGNRRPDRHRRIGHD
jgi:GT2 family glycosyltransferase